MAAIDNSRSALGSAPVANRFGKFIATLVAAVVAWNDARVTRNALAGLSDRELDDIGLVRGDIDDIANRLARRVRPLPPVPAPRILTETKKPRWPFGQRGFVCLEGNGLNE